MEMDVEIKCVKVANIRIHGILPAILSRGTMGQIGRKHGKHMKRECRIYNAIMTIYPNGHRPPRGKHIVRKFDCKIREKMKCMYTHQFSGQRDLTRKRKRESEQNEWRITIQKRTTSKPVRLSTHTVSHTYNAHPDQITHKRMSEDNNHNECYKCTTTRTPTHLWWNMIGALYISIVASLPQWCDRLATRGEYERKSFDCEEKWIL